VERYKNKYLGCYIGYPDSDLNEITGSPYGALYLYYGKNLPRLVKVKAAVDPHNYFRNVQSIPVDHEAFRKYFGVDNPCNLTAEELKNFGPRANWSTKTTWPYKDQYNYDRVAH
jgi:hypothetical protein